MADDTTQATSLSDNKIHYIIAVHGIGEQRKNETILPVIKQFAATRHNNPQPASLLSLGSLVSQSNEHPWIEFADIPKDDKVAPLNKDWIPIIADPAKGENFRFVDFCWSEVMREQHGIVGESTQVWSQTLINRLKLRIQSNGKATAWIVYLMETLQGGILFTEKIMNLRIPKISNEIFGEFLGDVELYGNFPHTRGRAVRLFHETMSALHQAHRNEFGDDIDPQYTIIAHSLGTVMTLDAITYAYANKASQNSEGASGEASVVHFPGYNGAALPCEPDGAECFQHYDIDTIPKMNWAQYLQSYVTLGSPIDKYLALWTENYSHFSKTDWMDQGRLIHRSTKIRHFNYSDEQDPVGQELDILRTTPVWNALFEIGEDIVFTRYAMPGAAHVQYWQDSALFHRIVDLTIDKREAKIPADKNPEGYYAEWFEQGEYRWALFYAYILLPIIGWFIATASLTVLRQSSFDVNRLGDFPWLSGPLFFMAIAFTRVLMELIIMWRLLLVNSRNQSKNSKVQVKPAHESDMKHLKWIIYGSPPVWIMLTLASFYLPLPLPIFYSMLLQNALCMASAISSDICHIYYKTHRNWDNQKTAISMNFTEYLLRPRQNNQV